MRGLPHLCAVVSFQCAPNRRERGSGDRAGGLPGMRHLCQRLPAQSHQFTKLQRRTDSSQECGAVCLRGKPVEGQEGTSPSPTQEKVQGTMNIKRDPNHKLYIQALRCMSSEARLLKAFELTQFSRDLFIHGLHRRFPHFPDDEIKRIYLERLDKCHNRNY